MKELLYNYLPQSIMDRLEMGFSITRKMVENELKYLIDNYLNEDAIVQTKIFNKDLFRLIKNSTVVKLFI